MAPVVVVPLGAWEQHGNHLPPATDTLIITAVAAAAAATVPGVVLAPTIPVTASDEHRGFDSTLSIGTEAFASSVVAIARSATWAAGVLFVNGHGGNADGLAIAHEAMDHEGLRHDIWSLPAYDGADAHAGRTETSVMLYLSPDDVDMDAARAGNTTPLRELAPQLRAGGVGAVSANGILGDPRRSDAADGERIFRRWLDDLVAACRTIWPEPS